MELVKLALLTNDELEREEYLREVYALGGDPKEVLVMMARISMLADDDGVDDEIHDLMDRER